MTSSTIASKDFESTDKPSEVLKPIGNLGLRTDIIFTSLIMFLTDKAFL